MGKLIVVAGAQFGSEGKGHVTDHLTRPKNAGSNVVAVRVAGPNAGHIVYGKCPAECSTPADEHHFRGVHIGHPWKLRSVPVGAVANPQSYLVIAPGSEIDPNVIISEIEQLDSAGYEVSTRLLIDAQATRLDPRHISEEVTDQIQKRLGSTAKGIGAARADRIWRRASLWGSDVDTVAFMRARLQEDYTVIIEGTQGYGLGLHAGHYPFCTSSDARVIDFLAMAGLSPWDPVVTEFEPWIAARVRPIRVAGNSGQLKNETTWSELGLPEERTTVTNKVRRVGEWDGELVRAAVQANGGHNVNVAITMTDTLFPSMVWASGNISHETEMTPELANYVRHTEIEIGAPIRFMGTSPVTGVFLGKGSAN